MNSLADENMIKRFRGTHLYKQLKSVYRFALDRKTWNHYARLEAFYRQFISRDDLVFDVGANTGEYTEVFVALGARVIAMEPNPECARLLKNDYRSENVVVEPVAIGDKEGEATLFLCDASVLGTLSQEWISVASSADRFAGKVWDHSVKVHVSTLNQMVSKYGRPRFVKIDVEGFEAEVLSGLSSAPDFVSFELNTEFADGAIRSIRQHCFQNTSRFNIKFGEETKWVLDEWVNADELEEKLSSGTLWSRHTYGDIFVASK